MPVSMLNIFLKHSLFITTLHIKWLSLIYYWENGDRDELFRVYKLVALKKRSKI